jgi:predicted porin
MKKSLIAAAVAGLFVAPAAMADVTISGAINIGIAHIDSDGPPGGPSGTARQSLATNYSNMNVSSVDDIGNGNKVILNIQFDLGALNNTSAFANRNSYLGIEGTWGSFKMGTNENVYERWMYESDPLDGAMGMGGNIQMLGQSGFAGAGWFDVGNGGGTKVVIDPVTGLSTVVGSDNGSFWRRTHHTVWYNSPNYNGFTFEVDYTLSAFKDDSVSPGIDPTVLSAGAQYKPEGQPWFVNFGYESHTDNQSDLIGPHDATGIQFGGGYTFGNIALTARYEMLEWEEVGGPGTLERTHIWVGAKMTTASGYFGAEIGLADDAEDEAGTIPNTAATMIGLGYFHNLSKQSQLYFVGTMISNDDDANYGIGAGTGSTAAGDQMGLTVGMKHTF